MGTREEGYSARDLKSLIEDHQEGGILSFEEYLLQTGNYNYIEFYWAYHGMRSLVSDNQARNKQLVNCIYSRYIKNGALTKGISTRTFLKIVASINGYLELEAHKPYEIFAEAVAEAEDYLRFTIHPEFIKTLSLLSVTGCLEAKNYSSSASKLQPLFNDCKPIQDEDGMPKVVVHHELKVSNKPPTNPETFAKELCQRLEALKLKGEPVYSRNKCPECAQEKSKLEKSFAASVVKAIEAAGAKRSISSPIEEDIKPDEPDRRVGCHPRSSTNTSTKGNMVDNPKRDNEFGDIYYSSSGSGGRTNTSRLVPSSTSSQRQNQKSTKLKLLQETSLLQSVCGPCICNNFDSDALSLISERTTTTTTSTQKEESSFIDE